MQLNGSIEYLKGVGPVKAAMLKEHLKIFTPAHLLNYFPYRYDDKSKITPMNLVRQDGQYYQIQGKLSWLEEKGFGKSKRLLGLIEDESGVIELKWYQNYAWLRDKLIPGKIYKVYGKLNLTGFQKTIAHPEMELLDAASRKPELSWEPVYSSNEKLSRKGLDSKGFKRIVSFILQQLKEYDITENLPSYILTKFNLPSRYECIRNIHFPKSEHSLQLARQRLKFEELFFLQLRMIKSFMNRKTKSQGFTIKNIGGLFDEFYKHHLPFELTGAQKKVIKEIHEDLRSGRQMNRLLQGDVGSGKTIVALLIMLLAISNDYQCCLMAPTEVLAQQHFNSISELLEATNIECALLTSNIKGKERKEILEKLKQGHLQILIGTHAVLEDAVEFANLGLAVIDEQHRFGVEQRARLWAKSIGLPPHILVMTATPIPRTLAMSLYGDLDISVIDELPPNRKPVKTLHFVELHRGKLYQFLTKEIEEGRQVYIVFPLIEESEKLDLENLELGYEKLLNYFPLPQYQISVVHGKLRPKDKQDEMQRFVKGITQLMVATTVIEVGVNVPNASVMVIESSERFGLSQLHQLRGRVGRGADQSYCILMTADHLSKEARARINIMCQTNDGFVIAEEDLKIRGPGNLDGTQQSGLLQLKIADIVEDQKILYAARKLAEAILKKDPELKNSLNLMLKQQLDEDEAEIQLGRIS